MRPFKFTKAKDEADAVRLVSANRDAQYIAGGTNIVDLMKEDVRRPNELIDISGLKLTRIKTIPSGLSIGALATNTDTANHPLVRQQFPLLSQAILAGASAQIRNMATNGGNLMQQVRCWYFYDVAVACNRREPGSGCSALGGLNRRYAIFGWSESCVAVNPSDMAVALAALDAVVNVTETSGTTGYGIPITEFHKLPGDAPHRDKALEPGELITSIELPRNNFAANSYYLKVGERTSYSFALVSVAAALELAGGRIKQARVALGGVANKPWRAYDAEKMLVGKTPSREAFEAAAAEEMKKAQPLEHNEYKVELGRRAITLALLRAFKGAAE
ncbi:MAG: xanthine dehydrogenase family protein subunit M [Acidobacteria bacterium]|nr:xanthine dehydrogenase family protein subunit M [Acidobacteriota bacterium]